MEYRGNVGVDNGSIVIRRGPMGEGCRSHFNRGADSIGRHLGPVADRRRTGNKDHKPRRYFLGYGVTFIFNSEWLILTDITFDQPDKLIEYLNKWLMENINSSVRTGVGGETNTIESNG